MIMHIWSFWTFCDFPGHHALILTSNWYDVVIGLVPSDVGYVTGMAFSLDEITVFYGTRVVIDADFAVIVATS